MMISSTLFFVMNRFTAETDCRFANIDSPVKDTPPIDIILFPRLSVKPYKNGMKAKAMMIR